MKIFRRGCLVVRGVLAIARNSFHYREESVIYDALERSADGELLTDIYLETRRSPELLQEQPLPS